MVTLQSKALDQSIQIHRIIGQIRGKTPGPTLIFVGGIHGNEPAGVFALDKVIKHLKVENIDVKGSIYAIAGNLRALKNGKRFEKIDLNRVWTIDYVQKLRDGELPDKNSEDTQEQIDLYSTLRGILEIESGPFYFFDLHTTSSQTIPFITVNDNLLNRKFTHQYPIPIVLGIEEYLDGPLLSYINELGYVAFGFEGGQHDDLSAIENHMAFVYLSLVFTKCINKKEIDYTHFYGILAKNTLDSRGFFEIFCHFSLNENDEFIMKPGYINFQKISKGEELASLNAKNVLASSKGKIFMPLYQKQGEDGFFIIRTIPKIFLRLSAILRTIRLDNWLTLLPGVQWKTQERQALVVNQKLARYFTKDFFHLLGYRTKMINENKLVMKNREAVTRKKEYKNTYWFNKN